MNNIFSKYDSKKGRTYEEIWGIKRALEIRKKQSDNAYFKKMKGKKVEEIFGEEKGNQIRKKLSLKRRNKGTYEQQFGKEKAELIKQKLRKVKRPYIAERMKKLKGKSIEEILGDEKGKLFREKCKKREQKLNDIRDIIKKKISIANTIDKNEIINQTKERFIKYGGCSKIEWRIFMQDICNEQTIRNKFGSLDDFANICGIKFKQPIFSRPTEKWHIGKNETKILNKIEQKNNIILDRQFYVDGFYIDGYDKENNVAYEIDEKHHDFQKIEDFIREQNIKNILGCNFVRINEQKFLGENNGI